MSILGASVQGDVAIYLRQIRALGIRFTPKFEGTDPYLCFKFSSPYFVSYFGFTSLSKITSFIVAYRTTCLSLRCILYYV